MPIVAKEIPEFRVKYKDVFHLKNLYVMMHEYLLEQGFTDEDGGHERIEKFYSENSYQKGVHAGGKELWLFWRLYKYPEGKYSGYLRWILEIDFHGTYMAEREVIHQGKKMKIDYGELEIFFRPKLEVDYKDEWEHHWLLKHFHKIYYKRILSQELDKLEKQLWREAYRLQGKVKQFLQLRTFIPMPEPFWHPIYGYQG